MMQQELTNFFEEDIKHKRMHQNSIVYQLIARNHTLTIHELRRRTPFPEKTITWRISDLKKQNKIIEYEKRACTCGCSKTLKCWRAM